MGAPTVRRVLRTAVLALAAVASPGCMFHTVEVNDPSFPQRAKGVVPGETREEQLKGILGFEPTSFITLKDGGRLLTYTYGTSRTGGLNLIVFSTQRTNSGLDTAFLLIRPDGVVGRAWIGDHSEDVPWEWWAFGE